MMQVNVETTVIQQALKTAQPLFATKLIGASDIVLRAQDNQLILQASNRSLSYSLSMPAAVSTPGEVLVDGFKLNALVTRTTAPNVSLNVKKRLVVTAGKSKAQLAVRNIAYSTFPAFDFDPTSGVQFRMQGSDLLTAIKKVAFAAAGDEIDFAPLAAVNLNFENGTAIATDKAQQAAYTIIPQVDDGGAVLVQADHLNALARALPSDTINVSLLPNIVIIHHLQDFYAVGRLSELFPEAAYELFNRTPDDSKFTTKLGVAKEELIELLGMAVLFAHSNATDTVTLTLAEGRVQGKMTSIEDEIVSELDTAGYDGEDLEISFSAVDLRSIVQKYDGDRVFMCFSGPKQPIYIFDTDEKTIYVQVPTVITK